MLCEIYRVHVDCCGCRGHKKIKKLAVAGKRPLFIASWVKPSSGQSVAPPLKSAMAVRLSVVEYLLFGWVVSIAPWLHFELTRLNFFKIQI
ncbi:hypothetical protein [Photobacterium carnosum]|uniref:hypothetical protein n=1 Tax=Photobacterium carnosum TaxID=2023717 RepID=UPI0024318B2C|nr:hypothetical protein [Photobacterium carnosum]